VTYGGGDDGDGPVDNNNALAIVATGERVKNGVRITINFNKVLHMAFEDVLVERFKKERWAVVKGQKSNFIDPS
jgi:hypothetical protein